VKKELKFPKDLPKSGKKLSGLPCIMASKSIGRYRMTTMTRRENIIERMKIRKFDTAYNLAFEFGVSLKTVLHDIQELSVSGKPIQAEPGRGGGIRWLGGKQNFPFTEREITALHKAIALASPEDKPVLEKLIRTNEKPEIDKNDIFGLLTGDITQRAFAAELGISESHLSRVLSGRKKPSMALAAGIAKMKEEHGAEPKGASAKQPPARAGVAVGGKVAQDMLSCDSTLSV